MNKKLFLFVSIPMLVFLSSCLTSLNRLVTYSTVRADNRITGSWQIENLQINIETLPSSNFYKELLTSIKTKEEKKSVFDSGEDSILYSNSYVANFVKNGYQYFMICSLIKFGNNLFANLEPVDARPVNATDTKMMEDLLGGGSYLASNTIARVVFRANEMEFQFIDPGYVRSQLTNGRVAIKYEKDNLFNTDLITASSHELQLFLTKYGSDQRLYNKENTITLKKI